MTSIRWVGSPKSSDGNDAVTPIGGTREFPCAGNPNRRGAVLNECGAPAKWVVVAPVVIINDAPAVAMVSACDAHVLPVQQWLRDRAKDAATMMGEPWSDELEPGIDPISAVERIKEHFGDM